MTVGQVLPGDELIDIEGVAIRGKHAREIKNVIFADPHATVLNVRLNRGGRVLDIKLPRFAADASLPQSQRGSASPSMPRGMRNDVAGLDAHVQHILNTASHNETKELEEQLLYSRRRHAARLQALSLRLFVLCDPCCAAARCTCARSPYAPCARAQEELARNRSDGADRLQMEIKVLRAEHAGMLEQKLAQIRQVHYEKVEQELDALRTQSAARLEERIQESRNASKERWCWCYVSRVSVSPCLARAACFPISGVGFRVSRQSKPCDPAPADPKPEARTANPQPQSHHRLEKQLEKLRADSAEKLQQQIVAERQRLNTQLLTDREWLTMT